MRVFISLKLSEEAVEEIKKIQEQLFDSKIFEGKLTEEQNLHLTLKFLGDVSGSDVEKVRERLRNIKMEKFIVNLKDLGVFNKDFVRIIWISILGAENLQGIIDSSLKDLFEKEKRFMSHLTIARIKEVQDKKRFFELLGKIDVKEIKFEVNNFQIIESKLFSKGPQYKIIEEFSLA